MKKKSFLGILSFFLAIVMAVVSPAQVIAASANKEYIKELRIGYGASGKATLEEEKYKILSNKYGTALNANQGGTVKEGSTDGAVYIGYKTTTNKEEAVTDIALMPMGSSSDRAYSFDAYGEEMEKLNEQIDEMLENFDATIQEFRENYTAGSKYAVQGYKLLNMLKEDDTGMKLGDLFLLSKYDDNTITAQEQKDAFHSIFMEGNSSCVNAACSALALGCTDMNDTIFDRLEEAEYTTKLSGDNLARNAVGAAVEELSTTLKDAQEHLDAAEDYEGGLDAYINALDEADRFIVANNIALLKALKEVNYGDVKQADEKTPLTLADAIMLSGDYSEDEDAPLMTDAMLSVLTKSLTKGQIGILPRVGLAPILQSAVNAETVYTDESGNKVKGSIKASEEALKTMDPDNPVSIYLGVDRTVFHDGNNKTVAITNAALQAAAATGGFAQQPEYETVINEQADDLAKILLGASILFGAVTVWIAIESIKVASKMSYWGGGNLFSKIFTGGYGEWFVVSGLATLALIGLAIWQFIKSRQKVVKPGVTYTPIPRAIIDVRYKSTGEGLYFTYHAATLAGSDGDYKNEKDTTKLYGDLNGLNGLDQWLCLYYANDLRLGSPLTPDGLIVKTTGKLTWSDTREYKDYVPIHGFDSSVLVANKTDYAALDLNRTCQEANHPSIFVFLKRDTLVTPIYASIFANTTTLISIGTFIAGAGLATFVTALAAKKKYKKSVPAAE